MYISSFGILPGKKLFIFLLRFHSEPLGFNFYCYSGLIIIIDSNDNISIRIDYEPLFPIRLHPQEDTHKQTDILYNFGRK